MPIEIKELHIKINVDEEVKKRATSVGLSPLKIKKFKAGIIKTCTREILEILKEKQER